jgi:hypothetical protein
VPQGVEDARRAQEARRLLLVAGEVRVVGFHLAVAAPYRQLARDPEAADAAQQDASESLKAGDRLARFPIGSFPPGLPFVRALPP